VRDVLGLNLGCGKVKNFVGKTLTKKWGGAIADGSPPPKNNFFPILGFFFIFVFAKY